jgi:AraC-like DNA-binding protein
MDTRPTIAFIPRYPYARLLDRIVELGHEAAEVLEAAGLPPNAFASDGGYLSLPQMEALVTRALELEPDRALGLEVGGRTSLMSHGWLSVAALSAPTIGDALDVLGECFALISPLFELLRSTSDGLTHVRLVVRWPLSTEVERFHLEAICASLRANLPPLLFRGDLPSGLALQTALPRPSGRDAFPIPLEFEASHHELCAPCSLAGVALPLADARVHALALRRCAERMAARPDPAATATTVRRVLLSSGPPFLDLIGTAKRLAMSSRSLRRRLRDEGTSFRSIVDEVRSMVADRWLDDPTRSITEIGLDLGYTDAANFARAYRRANGLSPSAARKQRLGLDASH